MIDRCRTVLGIDPGVASGAAVVLDLVGERATLRSALAWGTTKRRAGPVVRLWQLLDREQCVAEEMPAALPMRIMQRLEHIGSADLHSAAVERPITMRHRTHVPTWEEAGRMAGIVQALTRIDPLRPTAQDWRRAVCGLRHDHSDADTAVAAWMSDHVELPVMPRWARTAVHDATGVAMFALKSTR